MDPLLLQQQMVNNNKEFSEICNDLKSWGNEMEKKEQQRKPQKQEPEKKKIMAPEIKKQKVEESNRSKKQTLSEKKKCMSYEDWDKFDADKECEKIDEDSESDSDSLLNDLKDQALIEKDEGNKLVKAGKWNDAIKSYTNAIKYYGYDPIFYANRALCFLKTNQMEQAELDCNVSLQLDQTYVKAYQRRAAARISLNKLEEARLDLLRVLELEPKNFQSKNELEKLEKKIGTLETQKPVSKFSKSRQQFEIPSSGKPNNGSSTENSEKQMKKGVDSNIPEFKWPSGKVTDTVKAIQKPPHMRSAKPLKRIVIEEINSALKETSETFKDNPLDLPKKNENTKFDSDVKIMEQKSVLQTEVENVNNQKSFVDEITPELTVPKTSVQFHSVWKQLKGHSDKRGEYLKLINPQNIPNLFKDSLESDVFSEILLVLSENFMKESDETYDYLLNLSEIKRFSALSMFLTLSDKNSLWKLFNHMKEYEGRSKEDIDSLIAKYEL